MANHWQIVTRTKEKKMKIAFLLLEHFSTLMRSVLPTIEYLILRKLNILKVKSFIVSSRYYLPSLGR